MKNIKYIVFLLLSLLLPLQSISAQDMIVTAAAFKTSTFLEVPVKYADIDFSATAASESFAVKTNTSVKPVSDVSWLKAEMKYAEGVKDGENLLVSEADSDSPREDIGTKGDRSRLRQAVSAQCLRDGARRAAAD